MKCPIQSIQCQHACATRIAQKKKDITYVFKFDITVANRDSKVLKGQVFCKRQAVVGQTDGQSRQGSSVGYTDTDINRDTTILSVVFVSLYHMSIRFTSLSVNSFLLLLHTRMTNE